MNTFVPALLALAEMLDLIERVVAPYPIYEGKCFQGLKTQFYETQVKSRAGANHQCFQYAKLEQSAHRQPPGYVD